MQVWLTSGRPAKGDDLVVMIAGVDTTHLIVAVVAIQLIESFKVAFALPNGEVAMVGASVGMANRSVQREIGAAATPETKLAPASKMRK